jgi:pyruvate dehydrogenase (quinone)
VEFVTDPAVPPIPPHASWEQIEKTAESIIRGDSDRWDVVKEGIRSKVQEVLPGTKDHPDQVPDGA